MSQPADLSAWPALLDHVRAGDEDGLRRATLVRREELTAAREEARDGEPYGRRVLFADAGGEIMLASWRAGSACAPHDHGRARGMVVVLEGALIETWHDASLAGLTPRGVRAVGVGKVLHIDRHTVHAMRAETRALTLHVYAPGTTGMNVYDPLSRATLRVADGCGAWVPSDPRLVLSRWAWDAPADPGAPGQP